MPSDILGDIGLFNKENDEDIEELRERVISQIEAAIFSGLGAAIFDLEEAKHADIDTLRRLAERWGV